MSFQFEIRGLDQIKAKLERLRRLEVVYAATKQWAERTVKTLRAQRYPARRPGQKYVRTGKLGSSWYTEKRGNDVAIVNKASHRGQAYPEFVVGEKQAWMHKGRWWRAKDVIEKTSPTVDQTIDRAIQKDWNS